MGFLLLEQFTSKYSLSWTKPAREYRLSECDLGKAHLVFLKPETYMNLSGEAVRAFRALDSFEPEEFLVLCDDIALPLGRLRLRKKGSDGGHNGLRSIIESLDSQDFPRLRMGVGPVPAEMDPADFVLHPFLEEERSSAREIIERAANCIEMLANHGLDRAMGEYNAPLLDNETI